MAKQWNTPPAMQIDPKKQYKAHMETDKGTMVIELFADKTPLTVNNFVFLSREGYYDGVITFIRNADSIMIFGPGEAKVELETRMKLSNLGDRIVCVETAGKMTEPQIAAKVRDQFLR